MALYLQKMELLNYIHIFKKNKLVDTIGDLGLWEIKAQF